MENKLLIDAKGKFVLNAGDLTGHIMCFENGYITVFDRFAKVVCKFSVLDAPAVDAVEVVNGRWIEEYVYDPDPHDRLRYKCSVCGRTKEYREPYCNCGAKMDGEQNG